MAIYIDGTKVEIERFPNGEVRIPTEQFGETWRAVMTTVWLHWQSDADLIYLGMVKAELDNAGARYISLTIDYLPYSRMDRQTSDVFTLKFVTNFINSLNFDQVCVTEPHSDVSMALLDRAYAEYPSATWLLESAMADVDFNPDRDYLFFPDAGAAKRYHDLADKYEHMIGHKVRDQKNKGAITKYTVPDAPSLREWGDIDHLVTHQIKVLIVDDLCAYGGTFLAAATALRELGFRHVSLVVTHLEPAFWKGDLAFTMRFPNTPLRAIYTTNSMQSGIDEAQTHAAYKRVRFYDLATQEIVNPPTKE